MDWWSLFRRLRKVIFGFVALASLVWAIVLSLYLSKQWNAFTVLQRSIVLSLICVNGVTAVLIYLMIIVVFRMWMELLRMMFLVAIHVGTAVPFTLYAARFSCKIFDTQLTCKIVNITFLATAWSITGLLVGHTIYLCIMSRVPRPFPLVTPNDLLTGSTPPVSRSPSMSSMTSKTGLLVSNTVRPPSPASSRSVYSQGSASHGRTVPKRTFVANNGSGAPPQQPDDALARMRREQQARRGQSYGAMGSPHRSPPVARVAPVSQSRWSESTVASAPSAHSPPPRTRTFSPAQSSMMSAHSRQSSAAAITTVRPGGAPQTQRTSQNAGPRGPPRPLLLSPNPFMEPLSRHGTPETALSGLSFSSAPGNLNVGHMAAYGPSPFGPLAMYGGFYGGYLGPYSGSTSVRAMSAGVPSQLQPGARLGLNIPPYMVSLGPHASYSASPASGTPRMHNATPSNASIHSMAPSVHFANNANEHGGQSRAVTPQAQAQAQAQAQVQAQARTQAQAQAHAQNPYRTHSTGDNNSRNNHTHGGPGTATGTSTHLPPNAYTVAHMRMASDPLWRPYSAGARLGPYDNVELPNPYNRGAEIRRYGSVPHIRSGNESGGYGYAGLGYGGYGLGYAMGFGYGAWGREGGVMPMAAGKAAGNDPRWREMVMRAAATP